MNYTIWHISDIHIREGTHEDILYAIDQLVAKIKNDPTPIEKQLIVIAGDIFESKNKFSQFDLDCFYQMLDKIKFVKSLIIPGNHDYSPNADIDKKLDLVSIALKNHPRQSVFIYNRSGIYHIPGFPNIDFHILSPIDENIPLASADQSRYQVAVLHEPIKGCRLYGTTEINLKARFDIEDLANRYDLVLAGDIHKRQYLGEDKRVAYCGSLIQKNKGEDMQHGCIKWILTNKIISNGTIDLDITAESINFKLNQAYLIIQAKKGQLYLPQPSLYNNVKYVELRYTDCSEEQLDEFIQKVREKYGQLNNIVNLDKVSLLPKKGKEDPTLIPNIEIPNHHKLLEDALENDQNKEEILELHGTMCDKLADELGHIKNKWKLNFLAWSNIFRYGEKNYIDFNKLNGITSLIGKNKVGKSSIIDILVFALYNELSRGDRKSIINNGAPKYKLSCGFSILYDPSRVNGYEKQDFYIIVREGDNTKGHQNQKLRLLCKKHEGEWENITTVDIPQTYDKIKSLIGSYKDLLNINIATQDNIPIVSRKADDQITTFRKYFRLDQLEQIESVMKEKVKKTKVIIKTLEAKIIKPDIKISSGTLDKLEIYLTKLKLNLTQVQEYLSKRLIAKDKLNQKIYPDSIFEGWTFEQILAELEIVNEDRPVADHSLAMTEIKSLNQTLIELYQSKKPTTLNLADDELQKCQQKIDYLEGQIHSQKITSVQSIIEIKKKLSELQEEQKKLFLTLVRTIEREKLETNLTVDEINQRIELTKEKLTKDKLKLQKLYPTLKEEPEKPNFDEKNKISDTIPEILSKINLDKSKIEFLQENLTQLKYSLITIPERHTIPTENTLEEINERDKFITTELHKLNAEELRLAQPQTKLIKSCKSGLTREELNKISISETEIELLAQLKPTDPNFKITDEKLQHASLLKKNLQNLQMERKYLETKILLLAEVDIKLLKFEDNCSACKHNQELFSSSNIQTVQTELKKIQDEIKLIQQVNIYQANEKVQKKIDILADQQYYIQEDLRKITQTIVKLKEEKEQLVYKKYWLEEQTLLQQNLAIKEQIKISEVEKDFLYNSLIELEQRKSWLEYNEVITHNKKVQQQITELEQDIASLKKNQIEYTLNKNWLEDQKTINHNNQTQAQINKLEGQIISETEHLRVAEFISQLTEGIQEQNNYKQKILDEIKLVEQNKVIQDQINQTKQKIEKIQKILESYQKYEKLSSLKKKFEENNQTNEKLKTCLFNISRAEAEIKKLSDDLNKKEKLKKQIIEFNKANEEITACQRKQGIYQKYLSLIDSKKGIPYRLLKESCEVIQSSINQMLSDITDFSIELNFDLKKFRIDLIEGDDQHIPATQGSGFQKFVIDLCLRLVLARSHPHLPSFFIIDEGFGCMDQHHLSNTKDFMDHLNQQKHFDWVIVISHIEELHHITEEHLEIRSVDSKSILRSGEQPIIPETDIIRTEEQIDTIIDAPDPEDDRLYCTTCEKFLNRRNGVRERHLTTNIHLANARKQKLAALHK